jgi:hypothetical protein
MLRCRLRQFKSLIHQGSKHDDSDRTENRYCSHRTWSEDFATTATSEEEETTDSAFHH